MSEYRNLTIIGVGSETGGRFHKVLLAGACKIKGDVECDELSIPGSGKVADGDLTVHGPLSCSGAGKVEGAVHAEQMQIIGAFSTEDSCEISGDLDVAGSLTTEGACSVGGHSSVKGTLKVEESFCASDVELQGSLHVDGNLRATKLDVKGNLTVENNVEAEIFKADGPVEINGELNAESVELLLRGENLIESIVGGSVCVKKADDNSYARRGININLDFSFFKSSFHVSNGKRPHLAADLIEADEIDLEYTDCETVRGVNIHIGPECVIDRVEYSGTLTTDANCTVREKVKI
ncbi:MAG: polymer-forming cytoskeletal protein [Oscillospiraceae bacterium]|nr:polymer-forming cytoskeletal protein [Oscillospiraceae bacterium]